MAVILINFSINTQKRALSDGEIHVHVWMNAQHNKVDKTLSVGVSVISQCIWKMMNNQGQLLCNFLNVFFTFIFIFILIAPLCKELLNFYY